MKMGYTYGEISEILDVPIEVVWKWEKGNAPSDAIKIPLNVIKRRVSRYKLLIASSKTAPLHSALLGIFMGAGTASIIYTIRADRGHGEFEHIIALTTEYKDLAHLTAKIISKAIGTNINANEKNGKWNIKFKNRDLVCFLTEYSSLAGQRLKKIVEYSDDSILAWLFFFKLSRSRYGQYITHTKIEVLHYFKELEEKLGIKTAAEPIWHKGTYQLYVPKQFYKIIGDTRKDLTNHENWPQWLKKALPP